MNVLLFVLFFPSCFSDFMSRIGVIWISSSELSYVFTFMTLIIAFLINIYRSNHNITFLNISQHNQLPVN